MISFLHCRTRLAWAGSFLVFASLALPLNQSRAATREQPDVPADLGAYVIAHQAALAPYFSSKGEALLNQGAPLLLEMAGRGLLLAFLLGWGLNIFLARGYSTLFAPSTGGYKPAIVFATGILVLNVFVAALLGAGIARIAGSSQFDWMIFVLFATAIFVAYVFQVAWICYRFQTAIPLSSLFFLTLFVMQTFGLLATSALLLNSPADPTARYFMNEVVAGDMEAQTRSIRMEAARGAASRQQVTDQAQSLQNQIDENDAESNRLAKEIAEARESEPYLYSRIVKLHAQGSLATARDQFAALLNRFPGGSLNSQVEGQLTQVSSEIAAQDQQTSQDRAAHVSERAEARAGLIARARVGRVTLSEARKALLGKTRGEVHDLFGSPSETAANRWGFGHQMIFNPLTNEKSGLAVYFADGLVQSVDYYDGPENAK